MSETPDDFFAATPPAGATIDEQELTAIPEPAPEVLPEEDAPVSLKDAVAIRESLGLNVAEDFVESTLSNLDLRTEDIGIPLSLSERQEVRGRDEASRATASIATSMKGDPNYGRLWIDQAAGG